MRVDTLHASVLLACCVLGSLVTIAQAAEEFRVDTEIYLVPNRGKEQLIGDTRTLFTSSHVYDFPRLGTDDITILDVEQGVFVLLDPKRKVKVELTTRQVLDFAYELRARAKERGETAVFEPELAAEWDETEKRLTMSGEAITYEVELDTEPKFASAVKRYQTFADLYMYLNSMRAGNPPPFARIQVNEAIAGKGAIPRRVDRTLGSRRKATSRSTHAVVWQLSNMDQRSIETAGRFRVTFKQVSPNEFFQIPAGDTE